MTSLFARLRDHLMRTTTDLDAAELAVQTGQMGTTPIGELADRALADVCGVVRNVTIPGHGQVPALVVELYDGTGALSIVWLGRREIPGIGCGRRLRARGRITLRDGLPTMFNPRYELLVSDNA